MHKGLNPADAIFIPHRGRRNFILKHTRLATEHVLYISRAGAPAGSLSRINRSYPERKMNFHSRSLNPFRITAFGVCCFLRNSDEQPTYTYTQAYKRNVHR